MINVSNAWHLAISNDKRQYLEYADITLANGVTLNLENKDFWQGGFSYEDAVSADNDLQIGSTIVNKCNLVINNIYGDYDTYDFTNAKVILRIGLALDGEPEIVRRGTYTVNNATFNGDLISLECLDNMIAFDKTYDSKLTFPATLNSIVRDVCTECGIYLNTLTFPNDDYIVATRPEDESTTYREVLAWATQISGCFARCNPYGQLEIKWYPTLSLQEDTETILDGGIFDQAIPYASGAAADGGTFNPWTTGYDYDAGTFADIVTVHHITSLYNRSVSIDDVVITGVRVLVKDETDEASSTDVIHEYMSGTTGYVIEVENNPFITLDTANEVVGYLGLQLIGTKFRKASITHGSDPCIEAGDVALVLDRKNNIYPILVSKTTFSTSGAQQTVSSAQTPVRNSSARFSAETKNYVELRKRLTNERTIRERVENDLTDRVNNASGLYETRVTDQTGTITYLHNKRLLADSDVQIKISDVGVMVTPDGGENWYGLTVDGDMITRILTATGINADWIDTGQLVIRDNQGNVTFSADTATGFVRIVASEFSLTSGDTINSIATDRATQAFNDSKTYTDQTIAGYRDEVNAIIGNIQDQLDDKIESWYYDYEPTMQNAPASDWTTEADKKAHEGDVFYWKSTGHAYRFMDNNGTWGWQLIEDTGITTAIAKAEAAQTTADSKKRIFVAQPTPPYDIGDLWVQGETGDILKCAVHRDSGNYVATDWNKASKYTDDTALNTFIEGSYATTLQNIQGQIDGKAETWSQENDPATDWDTPSKRSEHIGDLWYNSAEGVQSYYRWNGTSWDELNANPPKAVFDEIDGKAQIYIVQPTPPYSVGDLWFNDATSDIMTCVNTRAEGDFVESDWQKRNKYTDDTAVENLQIGGRNLVKNTLNPDVSTVDNYPMLIDQSAVTAFNTGTKTVAAHGIRQTNTSASRTFIRFGSATISSATLNGLEQGETYTLSFDASWRVLSSDTGKSDAKTYAMKSILYTNKASASTFAIDQQESFADVTQADKGTEMSGRCEFTFTIDMTVTKLYLMIANERTTSSNYAIGDYIELRNIKLEKGGKATDWSPAIEDQSNETEQLLNYFVDGEFKNTINDIQGQLDAKAETWCQSTDPSTAWNTSDLKKEHEGDLWYCTAINNPTYLQNQTYRWNGSAWVKQDAPKEVFDRIDGKCQVFTGSSIPEPPYYVGDLWFNATQDNTGDIKTCVTQRLSGNGLDSDWKVRNKYTDDAKIDNWLDGTPSEIPKFSSFLDVLPNTINATVKSSGIYAEKASIIATINNSGESEVTIDSNKVNLTAYSKISDVQSMISQKSDEITITFIQKANEKNSSYHGKGVPTTSNYPALSWATNEEKQNHDGDMYVDSDTNNTYQYNAIANTGLLLTFSSDSRTESLVNDYVVIYYKLGNYYYASERFGGSTIAKKTFFVPSHEFYVYFHTDSSASNYYGFRFSSITRVSDQRVYGTVDFLPNYTPIEVRGSTYPQSAHNPYGSNLDQLWKYTYSSGFTVTINGSWTLVKDPEIATLNQSVSGLSTTVSDLSTQVTHKIDADKVITQINLEQYKASIKAEQINFTGFTKFVEHDDLSKTGKTTSIYGGYIQTNTLSADAIWGGTLKLGGTNGTDTSTTYGNGQLYVYNSKNVQKIKIDSTGAYFGRIESGTNAGKYLTTIDISGNLTTKSLTATDYIKLTGNSSSYLTFPLNVTNGNTKISGTVGFGTQANTDLGLKLNWISDAGSNGYETFNAVFSPFYGQHRETYYNRRSGNTTTINYNEVIKIQQGYSTTYLGEGTLTGLVFQYSGGSNFYFTRNEIYANALRTVQPKNRVVKTKDYATRLLYCYETPAPCFGDIGEGVISEDGLCYVSIEAIFSETIVTDSYYVFLQKHNSGDCFVKERKPYYFIVSGTPGLRFSWELKAKQIGYDQLNLERYDQNMPNIDNGIDYSALAIQHIQDIQSEREVSS